MDNIKTTTMARKRSCRTRKANAPSSSPSAPSSTTTPSLLLTQLNDDLLGRVFKLAGQWPVARNLCHATRLLTDRLVGGLVIKPRVSVEVLRRLLARVGPGLRTLDLSGCAVLDDALLRHLIEHACPHLTHLSVSYCAQLTPTVTPFLFRVPHVALRGCWRLLRPCPSLPSDAVLELQLLALQQNDHHCHDGVAKHFEFASPANRAVEEEGVEGGEGGEENGQAGMQQQLQQQQLQQEEQQQEQEDRRPSMDLQAFARVIYERLQPMLGCHSFSVRQLQYESPDRACFLVRTTQGKKATTTGTAATVGIGGGGHGKHQHHQHYLWLLSRQAEGQLKDCWMTDAIVSAEHGLLSFLNLPLCAEEGGGRGGGGRGADAGGVWLQQCAAGGGEGVE